MRPEKKVSNKKSFLSIKKISKIFKAGAGRGMKRRSEGRGMGGGEEGLGEEMEGGLEVEHLKIQRNLLVQTEMFRLSVFQLINFFLNIVLFRLLIICSTLRGWAAFLIFASFF